MKPYKILFTDKEGKKEKKGFENEITSTRLLKPSQYYVDDTLTPLQEESRILNERMERERKIAQMMREIAIKALKEKK